MPDLKITELTENTTPLSTDVTVIVDDPAGTPATQKVTLANLASLVLSHLKASGANVTTGTSDVTIVTPKAMGDAGVNTRLKTKLVSFTRDLTTATGTQAITGVGFQPSALFVMAGLNSANFSWGIVDSAKTSNIGARLSDGNFYNNPAGVGALLIWYEVSSGNRQTCVVASYDADGFTLSWTKTGTPTGSTTISALCFG